MTHDMKTLICPACGCSLVRLGIGADAAIPYRHAGVEYRFCCQGCVDLFVSDPDKRLQETEDLIVCPTCLAEKPRERAVKLEIAGQEVYFCRCPYCAEAFAKNPSYYIGRLQSSTPNPGVLDHEGCCVRPE